MHISALLLTDAANVREGLLNVLGGGLTLMNRPSFPAPLMCDIAIAVSQKVSDRRVVGKLTIRREGSPSVIAETEWVTEIDESAIVPGIPNSAPSITSVAIDARDIALPSAGTYTLTASLQGGRGMSTSFIVVETPLSPGAPQQS